MNNFHTHCCLCKHASGQLTDYIDAAIENGFGKLGFTDHAPLLNNQFAEMRMSIGEASVYINDLKRLKASYADRIKLYTGFECENIHDSLEFYRFLLDIGAVDYLIGISSIFKYKGEYVNIHNNSEKNSNSFLEAYFNNLKDMVESRLFTYIVEPDLFYLAYNEVNEFSEGLITDFMQFCSKHNVILELNGLGVKRRLEHRDAKNDRIVDLFWNNAKSFNVQVIPGSDAHMPTALYTNYQLAVEKVKEYHLINIVEDIFA